MRKSRKVDYVVGLITGRTTTSSIGGKQVTTFVPNIENKYPTLKEVLIEKESPTFTRDDIFVREGVIPPVMNIDYTVFKKNSKQRKYLKYLKKCNKRDVRALGFDPKTRLNTDEPMIIRR